VIIGTGMVVTLMAMVAVVIVAPAMATVRPCCVRDRYRTAETQGSVTGTHRDPQRSARRIGD